MTLRDKLAESRKNFLVKEGKYVDVYDLRDGTLIFRSVLAGKVQPDGQGGSTVSLPTEGFAVPLTCCKVSGV